MKNVRGKWVLPVILVIILVFSYFSLVGYRTQYADIVTTHTPGVSGVKGGQDVDGTVNITFYPDDANSVDKTDLNDTIEIMKARLYLNYNITDCDIYADYDAKTITVRYAWDGADTLSSPSTVRTELGGIGNFYIRGGTNATDDVLLDDSDLSKVTTYSAGGETYVGYYFNDQGKTKLAQATAQYNGSTISIWIDNVAKVRVSVTEVLTDGFFMIKSAETVQGSQAIVNTLSMKKLPTSFSASPYSYEEPAFGENADTYMLIALIIFFVVIAVVLIVKFRMPGFAAVIALLGYISFFVMNANGTMGMANGFRISIPLLTAFALTCALVVYTMFNTLTSIKNSINGSASVIGGYKAGRNDSLKRSIYLSIGILVVASALYGMFGFKPSFLPTLFTPFNFFLGLHGNIEITEFAHTMLFGLLGNLIFGIFFFRLMLISVRGSKYFTDNK